MTRYAVFDYEPVVRNPVTRRIQPEAIGKMRELAAQGCTIAIFDDTDERLTAEIVNWLKKNNLWGNPISVVSDSELQNVEIWIHEPISNTTIGEVDMPTIARDEAERQNFLRGRVCSDCWGELTIWKFNQEKQEWSYHCETPDCECRGTISRSTKAIIEERSLSELVGAMVALKDAAPWIAKRTHSHSIDQILRQLGF